MLNREFTLIFCGKLTITNFMNMVNAELSPVQKLILAYSSSQMRPVYDALFVFDNRFATMFRTTSETLILQLKLTWWRDLLTVSPEERPTGEPLVSLLNELEGTGFSFHPLIKIIDGWKELLIEFPWDDRQFDQYAKNRGEGLFEFALSQHSELTEAQRKLAQSWALWDFARHCSDQDMRALAFAKCTEIYRAVEDKRFDRNGRPLSILCNLVASDVENGKLSDDLYRPRVAGKIIWHGMTGL